MKEDSLKASSFYHRGHVYKLQDRYKEAIVDINRAVSLNDKNPEALLAQSALLAKKRNYDEALSTLKKALTLDPELKHQANNEKLFRTLKRRKRDEFRAIVPK